MPVYKFDIIQFSDISPAPSATATVSDSGTFTVSTGAAPILLSVDDDENVLHDGFVDPPGFSTPANNQLLTDPVTVNGTTYPAGSTVELEFAITTTAGDTFYYIRIAGANVGLSGPTLPPPGLIYTISGTADGQGVPFASLPCFARGTRIATPRGARPIEHLRPGDRIRVEGAAPQPIRWIGSRRLGPVELAAAPHLRPIRIAAGALGNARDLLVSPQHRFVLRDWRAALLFDTSEVLVPAKALLNDTTIRPCPESDSVEYWHILFDRHRIIFAEGCATESLLPGATCLDGMARAARAEVLEIFPGLDRMPAAYGPPARPILRGFEAAALLRAR